ncbi:MAG: hypothetical protein M5U28_47280 [Sandaracinaceae bacterium]|nr:hypothetical protein [Sandaracinaceae bacterium]
MRARTPTSKAIDEGGEREEQRRRGHRERQRGTGREQRDRAVDASCAHREERESARPEQRRERPGPEARPDGQPDDERMERREPQRDERDPPRGATPVDTGHQPVRERVEERERGGGEGEAEAPERREPIGKELEEEAVDVVGRLRPSHPRSGAVERVRAVRASDEREVLVDRAVLRQRERQRAEGGEQRERSPVAAERKRHVPATDAAREEGSAQESQRQQRVRNGARQRGMHVGRRARARPIAVTRLDPTPAITLCRARSAIAPTSAGAAERPGVIANGPARVAPRAAQLGCCSRISTSSAPQR